MIKKPSLNSNVNSSNVGHKFNTPHNVFLKELPLACFPFFPSMPLVRAFSELSGGTLGLEEFSLSQKGVEGVVSRVFDATQQRSLLQTSRAPSASRTADFSSSSPVPHANFLAEEEKKTINVGVKLCQRTR